MGSGAAEASDHEARLCAPVAGQALAGCSGPTLDAEDIAYTREVLIPHLGVVDTRTCIECLFGDAAARTLGFTPRGLSPWAGLALALQDARNVCRHGIPHFSCLER
jgi:hypothetical protein